MYRNGRALDPAFLADERLFFRCTLDGIGDAGRIKPACIHFPDQSVNREKYSRGRDVLLPDGSSRSREWIHWGVAMVRVEDVPPETRSSGGIAFQFTVEHDPLEDNYAHSELRVYKNGQRERDKGKINPQVKKEYRTNLALRARVVIKPLV